MTDQEKQSLSGRMASSAEAQGLPGELVWERAWACPAGHVMTGRAVNDTCLHYEEASRQVCGRDVRRTHIALDLTNPTYFLPLADAWLSRRRTWRLTSSWHWEGRGVWMAVMELLEDGAWIVRFVERDADRTVAEAKALCEAMAAEKGAH